MAFDGHKNLSYSTVATAPSPASSGPSLVVASGDGSKFPSAPFNAIVWPVGAQATQANSEIVRVTLVSTDTFTITRAQESSSARSIVVGDQIAATITAKVVTDLERMGMWPTAVKTSGYTAAAGDFVPCDTTSAGFTVTLPIAPTDGTRIGVALVKQASTNAVTVAAGGSDVFDVASGTTTATISLLFQSETFQYSSSSAIWYRIHNRFPKTEFYASFSGDATVNSSGSVTVSNLHLSGDTAINHKLTSVTDPGSAQDAATKNYVDTAVAGGGPVIQYLTRQYFK